MIMKHRKAITEIAIFVLNMIYCSRNLHGDILAYVIWYIYCTLINITFIIFDIIWEYVVCKIIIDNYYLEYDNKFYVNPLLIFSSTFIYIGIRYHIENEYLIISYLPVLIPKIAEFIILSIKTKNRQ